MKTKLLMKLSALGIAILLFTVLCIPSVLMNYFFAWLIDFAITINFSSWVTHVVIWVLGVVATIGLMNTKEAGELTATIITGKR